jgi:hypothetical protein
MGYGSYNEDIDERKGDTSDRYSREDYLSNDSNKSLESLESPKQLKMEYIQLVKEYNTLAKKFKILRQELKETQIDLENERYWHRHCCRVLEEKIEQEVEARYEELKKELENSKAAQKKSKAAQKKLEKELHKVTRWHLRAEEEIKKLNKKENTTKKLK